MTSPLDTQAVVSCSPFLYFSMNGKQTVSVASSCPMAEVSILETIVHGCGISGVSVESPSTLQSV